jgi:hypothetical protein
MSASKHTPGPADETDRPWTVKLARTGNWIVYDADTNIVANCGPRGEVRARLIAAAPDAAGLLRVLSERVDQGRPIYADGELMEAARALLARLDPKDGAK